MAHKIMASITLLGSIFDTNSGTHTVTATPAVGDLIVIVTMGSGNTSSATCTDNNSSGAYTIINSALKVSSADKMTIQIRTALIAAANSTIFSYAPGTSTGGGIAVYKVTGMNQVGAAAAVQSAIQSNIASGTPAPVMGGAVKTQNPVIMAAFNGTNVAGLTARSSPAYTLDVNTGYNSPTSGASCTHVNSGETASTLTWGSSSASAFCSIAVELDITALINPASDSTAVSATPTVEIISFINNSDSTAVTEVTTNVVADTISETDSTAVSDTPTIEIISFISASDSTAVTDLPFYYDDTAIVWESVAMELVNTFSVVETTNVVDQSLNQGVDTNNITPIQGGTAGSGQTSQAIAQSFTAMGTSLTRVDLKLFKSGTPTDNLLVDIVSALDGTSLGNVTVAASSISSGAVKTFNFAAPIALTIGNLYYIQVTRDGARDTSNYISAYTNNYLSSSGAKYTPYPGGTGYLKGNTTWDAAPAANSGAFAMFFSIFFSGFVSVEEIDFLNKTDSTSVSDTPTLQVVNAINVNDSSAVSDTSTILIPILVLSVIDSTAVSDNPTVETISLISKTDSTAVSDTPSLQIVSTLSVTDSSAVSDTPTIEIISFVSESESTAISDTPTIEIFSFVLVSDSSAVSDTPTIEMFSFINVSDSSAVSDAVTIVALSTGSNFSVSDSTAVSDTPTIEMISYVNITDSSVVSDTPTIEVFSFINNTDSTAVSDTPTVEVIDQGVAVNDSTSVADTPTIELISFISKTDSTAVSDTPAIEGVSLPNVSDSSVVSDVVTMRLFSNVSITDSSAVLDTVTMELFSFISVTDSSAVSDTSSIFIPILKLSVSESSAVSDTSTISIPALTISVSDSTSVNDTTLFEEEISFVFQGDTAAVSDTPTIFLPYFTINVFDSTLVSDTPNIISRDFIQISDATAVSDSPTLTVIKYVSVAESSAVSDTPNMAVVAPPHQVHASDSVAVSDISNIEDIEEGLVVSETTAIGESVSLRVAIPPTFRNHIVELGWHASQYEIRAGWRQGGYIVSVDFSQTTYTVQLGWRKSGYIIETGIDQAGYGVQILP